MKIKGDFRKNVARYNTESSHFPHHKMFASVSLRHGWVL